MHPGEQKRLVSKTLKVLLTNM